MLLINVFKRILKIYPKEDLQYFFKHGKFKFFQQLLSFALSFFLIWYFANYTSIEFYGNYQFIIATNGLFLIFSFPGIKDSILQSVARGYEYSLIVGTKKAIKISLIGCIFLILLSGYYFFFEQKLEISIIFLIFCLIYPFYYTLDNFIYFLEGKKKFKSEFYITSFFSIIKLLLIFLSLLIFKENLIILFIITFVSQILIYFFFFWKCCKKIKDIRIDEDLIHYGSFMTKISLLGTITGQIDKFIIGFFMGTSSLAIYSIGLLIPEKIKDLIKPIFSSLVPQFAQQKIIASWKQVLFLFISGVFISIILIISIPIIINLFFSKFSESIIYGQIYSILFVSFFVNMYLAYYFRGNKFREGITKPTIYSQVVYLLSLSVLIYFYHEIGIILAKIIQLFVSTLILLYQFKKYTNSSFSD
ncbi:oligosaccharide flippase family protein [Candidatus Lokiarchaeum ossiferum]|uniref:oligosaccharide flippase family protein n=1 Tax=Candidatus Lokiarchaeum ossiferum TaxID=2951803 RepID=UPI00352CDCC0